MKDPERIGEIELALTCLALCHSVVVKENKFNANSQDELALISFAKFAGFVYLGNNSDEVATVY